MPYCFNRDVKLYYEVHGAGRPLIFFSGLSGGSWSWFMQVPYFKDRYKVIVFDNRGAGRSSKPPGPYSMVDLANDAVSILDHLNFESVYVVGVSMGGMIAQQFALLFPERVRAMVLGCTHCGKSRRVAPSPEVLETLMKNDGLSHEEIIDKNIPLLFNPTFVKDNPDIIKQYKKASLSAPPQPLDAFNAQLAAIQGFDVCEELTTIPHRVLIFTGTEDILVPPENSRILKELIPDSTLIEFEGAGHAIHIERADEFNRKTDEFFS